jgi:hypothetical protein
MQLTSCLWIRYAVMSLWVFLNIFFWTNGQIFAQVQGIKKSQQGQSWSDVQDAPADLLFPKSTYNYDYGDPTAAEQAHLEAINRARMDPTAEAARLGINLFEGVPPNAISGLPVQPLVMNLKLTTAARLHSQDMIDYDFFAHDSLDGKSPFDRMKNAGYVYASAGENLAVIYANYPIGKVQASLDNHDNLFIDKNYPDRGHRVNILTESFKEVGVGTAFGEFKGLDYGYMLTCDFGSPMQFSGAFILGVVYEDMNQNGVYDAGEGIANTSIDLVGAGTGTATASQGGYGIPITSGTYTVQATLPDGSTAFKTATMAGLNQKVDFQKSEFGTSGPQVVGSSPGMHTQTVSATELVTLMVNVTNSAGQVPVNEWIWIILESKGVQTPIFALTSAGWKSVESGVPLEKLAYKHGASTTFILGTLTMSDLGLGTNDSLTFGYAYTATGVTGLTVENMVTLLVK